MYHLTKDRTSGQSGESNATKGSTTPKTTPKNTADKPRESAIQRRLREKKEGVNTLESTSSNTATADKQRESIIQRRLREKRESTTSQESTTSKETIPHDEIFDFILEKVKPFNYLDFANSLNKTAFDKLNQDQYAQYCALKAIDYIRKNGADIRVINYKKATLYNGKFWQIIDELDDIADFLKRFAKKTEGIPPQMLAKVRFLEALPKQFLMNCGKIPRAKNTDTAKINLNNGTLHINKKGVAKLLPHNPNDYLQGIIDYDYDPDATCPRFDKFLNEVLPNETQQALYFDYTGASFFQKLKLEKVVLLLGLNGANGKSTLLDITAGTLGRDNISYLTPDQLLKDDPNFFLPQAEGKLLNIASEMGKKINSEKLKRYASGEPITAENKGEKAYTIYNYPRLIISVNNLPRINDTGNSVYRRLEILKFDNEIHPDNQKPDLKDEILKDEKAGILNRFLKGVKNIAKNRKLPTCSISQAEVTRYKEDGDSVLSFLEERGYEKTKECITPLDDIYTPYVSYCEAGNGIHCLKPKFRQRLEQAGYKGIKGKRLDKKQYGGYLFNIVKM